MSPQVRDLIYREILEYHPQMLADFLSNGMNRGANFMYPSAVDNFRRQCAACLTRHSPPVCLRCTLVSVMHHIVNRSLMKMIGFPRGWCISGLLIGHSLDLDADS